MMGNLCAFVRSGSPGNWRQPNTDSMEALLELLSGKGVGETEPYSPAEDWR